jgi:hypothetical protein
MIEKMNLPEGITYNKNNSNNIELEFIEEIINDTKCIKCGLHLQAVLVTDNYRHSGFIKAITNGKTVWENSLPRDRVRSIKMLNENLASKLDKHMERHKND